VLIADVEGLAGGILHRIVVPWRQAEFMGIFRPGVAGSALGNNRPEIGVGQHIDPRCRSDLAVDQRDDILTAVVGEAAITVVEQQVTLWQRRGWNGDCGAARHQVRHAGSQHNAMFQLLGEGSAFIVEHDSCRGSQQDAILVRKLIQTADKDAAGFIQNLPFNAGCDHVGDLIMQGVAVN